MKKEVIKPFDLAKAKAGAKLRTKEGYPVEIFRFDARGEYPILGAVIYENKDVGASWNSKGEWYNGEVGDADLVIIEEVQEPEFWSDCTYNTFDGFIIDNGKSISKVSKFPNIKLHRDVFATKKQAKSALAMARISQIPVDVETSPTLEEHYELDRRVMDAFRHSLEEFFSDHPEFLPKRKPHWRFPPPM